MRWRNRYTAIYLGILLVTIAGATVAYWQGMAHLEDDPVTWHHAFQVVIETFTTTGYGSDSPWATPGMNLFVALMDVVGTVMLVLALPVFLYPLLEDAIAPEVREAVDEALADHVVIVSGTDRLDPLLSELDSWEVPYVIVEPDRETALERSEARGDVIHAQPDEVEGLQAANLGEARALIADLEDRIDASIVLTARELDEDVRIVSVVEEPDRAPYHELAGADAVVSPRPLVGERLAAVVTATITTEFEDAVGLGEDFHIVELPVPSTSELVGRTIAESRLRERAGVNVLGAWFRGEFESPPRPDAEIQPGTVLLVTGDDAAIERLGRLSAAVPRPHERGETIVVGFGEVGQSVAAALEDADVPYTVLDVRDKPEVDVVGDATDPEALQRAGIDQATSLVLAIPEDSETEFATLVAQDAAPALTVVARADEASSVQKLYRAGADYVLALDTVTGRMLASTVVEEEVVLSTDTQVEVVRLGPGQLGGRTLAEADVRARTGCTVVAVERGGEVLTDLGPDFELHTDDGLVVVGTDDGLNRFTETFE